MLSFEPSSCPACRCRSKEKYVTVFCTFFFLCCRAAAPWGGQAAMLLVVIAADSSRQQDPGLRLGFLCQEPAVSANSHSFPSRILCSRVPLLCFCAPCLLAIMTLSAVLYPKTLPSCSSFGFVYLAPPEVKLVAPTNVGNFLPCFCMAVHNREQ